MVRIALVIGLSCCCSIAWSQETIREEGVAVRYSGIGDDYANAIARTVSAARTAAIEKFQFDMPETIFVEVMADDSRKVRLFNDGHDRFSPTARTEKDLAQPASSGTFHI